MGVILAAGRDVGGGGQDGELGVWDGSRYVLGEATGLASMGGADGFGWNGCYPEPGYLRGG